MGGEPYDRPQHFNTNGHAETFNFWWALMHAYYATGQEALLDRLKAYHKRFATHAEQADELLRMASGWDDRLGNAAYYIAEVQGRR